jgi:hypothetical protein
MVGKWLQKNARATKIGRPGIRHSALIPALLLHIVGVAMATQTGVGTPVFLRPAQIKRHAEALVASAQHLLFGS